MADVIVRGPLSGRSYVYAAQGDSLTADEQRELDALMRQREAQFSREYTERYGAPVPGAEGSGFLDYLGEIPKGILRGGVNFGQQAALGAAALLPERFETPVREGILGASRYLQSGLQPDIGFEGRPVAEGIGKLSEGLGSFGALAATSLLPGGMFTAGALATGAGAGEASERARAAGATVEERGTAAMLGAPVGALEMIPLRRLERVLGAEFTGTILSRLRRIAAQAGVEGAQEAAAEVAQNLIQQGIYDPEQGTFAGTGEAFGYGAGVGGIVQGLLDLAIGRRSRGGVDVPPPAATTTPAPEQGELFDDLPTQGRPAVLREGQVQGEMFPDAEVAPSPAASLAEQMAFDFDRTDQDQIDLFAEPTVVPGRAQRVAPEPSAVETVSVEPTPTNYEAVLDELGVPRSAAIRKAVKSGAVKDDDTFRARLAKFAAATTSERAAPVNEYLRRQAEPAPEPETALEVEPDPVTEITDAETAPSGPVESDELRSGDGFERGSEQPSAQPVAGEPDAPPAGAPDLGPVGGAVLGAPEPSVAEGPRPDALTPAAPKPLPAKREKQLAPIRDYFTPGNIVESYGSTDRVLSFDVDPNGDWSVTVEPVKQENGQWVPDSRGQPVRTHQTTPDKRRLAKGPILRATAAPEAAPNALTQRTPVSDEEFVQKVRDAQAEGIRPRAQTLLEQDEIAARRATLAEPTAPPMPAPQGPMTGQIPGVTTGAAGQVIPSPRLAEPPAGPSPAAPDVAPDTATDRVVARIEEARQHATAMQRLTAWFNKNASADLKLAAQTLPTDRETETLPAADVNAVVSLLETTKDKDTVTPAVAALRYFGRLADPGYALHAIAYDAAQARGKEGAREAAVRTKNSILGTGREPETENDRATLALLKGQGWETAQKAEQWIKDNLSPATYARLVALQSTRANKDRAGYTWIDYGTRSEKRDKVRGATAAGRVGPAQAISEPTAAQVKARAEKVERDREALENAARESRGLTPQQWGALSDAQRQDLVLDYIDLQDMSRGPSAPATPDFLSMPEEAPVAPVRRAIPRRKLTPAQEALEQLRAEIEDAMVESSGPAEVSFSFMAGQTTWPSDSHPRVGQLIRAGDFKGALRALAATAPSSDLRQLATKLLARIGDTQVQVVSPDVMNAIRAELSPETPTLGVETPAGVYVHPRNADQIAAMRREGHNAAADLTEQYGGQILFNETSPLAPELVLHEAVHRVADGILSNPSHVLTRQLDKLRTNLLKFMPANEYGLSNVRELLTEGMTNPTFRRNLSYVNTEGKPYSAWQEFKQIMRNFLRNIMGRPSVKPDTALTTLDRALDAVLATNPNEMSSGDIVGASFAPGGARAALRSATERVRVPTKADLEQTRRVLQDTNVPSSWKDAFMRLFMPLDYVCDAASKYLPSARKVHDAIMQHQAEIQRTSSLVMQTTEAIAKNLSKYRTNQNVIDDFNRVLFQGTLNEVDVRKPRSAYEGHSYRYAVLDSNGNRIRTVESKRYPTETERNKALQAYNASLPQTAPPSARARRSFDADAEQLQAYDRLRPRYDAFSPEVKAAVGRSFEMPVALGKELTEAIRARLEALLPNQKALQDKVYGIVYEKILAGQLIDPYQPLRRTGEFWLAYEAVDPETGRNEVFKHAFDSEGQRAAAVRMLESAPADQQIRNIDSYQNVGSMKARARVPMEFVARVLDTIDGSDTMDANVKGQVIELMFDTLPETSFVNSFRRRANIRGFIADFTPITEGLTAGDTIKNLRESSMRIARQTADLKYGAQFSSLRTQLEREYNEFQGQPDRRLSQTELAQQRAEVARYHDLLSDYTTVPFKQRAGWSRMLTGGTYMLTLGFNVSTALITMSQVPLFVAPFLSGRYGMRNTLGAIGAAQRILTSTGRERTVERVGADGQIETVRVPVRIWDYSVDNLDFTQPENAYLAQLHDTAKRNGVFNRSLLQDELLGEQPTPFQRFAAATGVMQHHAERYSRETALLAAYHLDLQKQMGNTENIGDFVEKIKAGTLTPTPAQAGAAAESAVNTSEKTNGPIYAAAGPMASQNDIGAILYLFKRHPLAMLNLVAQTALRANPLGTNDPADRKIAQKQLGGMMGMMGLMAGAMGLPMMQQIGWVYDSLFADDDEPDFETVVRTTLGEAGAFGLVDFLTDTRISERIGLGGAIYRPGFGSDQLPLPYQVLEGVGGPVVGLGLKYLDRVPKLLNDGEYQRAMEAILPSAAANVARAIRFNQEGIRTMRYDPIVDDIGLFSVAAQSLGFMPAQYAQQLAINTLGTRINNAIDTKRTKLLRQRYVAMRKGDFTRVQEIDVKIAEFNQRHPGNAITASTLRDSLTSHQRTTNRTHHGVAYSPRNEAYIRSLTEQFGPSSIFK
jgi:hypothetical protein